MTLLKFRKPNCVMMKKSLSDSGKYLLFYGHHFSQGRICYVVGAVNQANGEITMRHYNEQKAEALRVYDNFQRLLTRKQNLEERDDNSASASDEFRRALTQRNTGSA